MEFGPVIKNPVLDINKLVRQGTMLNQRVQNVDGDSTADQATVDLLAKKDPVIHEISVGISGEEASLYTVSGTPPLSLHDSLGKPLKAWAVEVSPYQEGSGDPSPTNVRPIHGTDKLNLFVEESYDPTATPKAVLTLPQTVYTGTIGSEGGESRWGEVDLGTLTWQYNVAGSGCFSTPSLVNSIANRNALCEQYNINTTASTATVIANAPDGTLLINKGVNITGNFSVGVVLVKDNRFTSVSDFVEAVNGVKFVYELTEPVQFTITEQSVPTTRGTATTWATAEDGTVDGMEVTYVGKV